MLSSKQPVGRWGDSRRWKGTEEMAISLKVDGHVGKGQRGWGFRIILTPGRLNLCQLCDPREVTHLLWALE